MIRANYGHDVIVDELKYVEYAGLFTDTKPTKFGTKVISVDGQPTSRNIGIATGSLFLEVDTGDVYAFDEASSQWKKIASLGGGS